MYPKAHYRKRGCPACLGENAKDCGRCGGFTLMRDWFVVANDPTQTMHIEGAGLKPMGVANKPKKGHPWIRSKQAIYDAKRRKK
jgi:hypothetical protein